MLDDRNLRRGGILFGDLATLQALARVLQRMLVGVRRQTGRLQPGGDAGMVHQLEHVAEAPVRLAKQPAAAVAVVAEAQGGGGVASYSQLVFEAGGHHVVELADRPVLVDAVLGNDEQADALHPRRGIGKPGEHRMDDVLGDVLVAAGDEALGTGQQIIVAVLGLHRGGLDVAQRAAGLRFGEAHGPTPLTRTQLLHVGLLQLVIAERKDQSPRRRRRRRYTCSRRCWRR